MREVKAVIRVDRVPEVVAALREGGVQRFYVTRVHVLGTGIDPRDFHPSPDEGEVYTEKAKVEILCAAERVEELIESIREAASTGHLGDGIVSVTDLTTVLDVRTGDRDRLALM